MLSLLLVFLKSVSHCKLKTETSLWPPQEPTQHGPAYSPWVHMPELTVRMLWQQHHKAIPAVCFHPPNLGLY
jgi:hypothetical protein